MRGSRSGFLIGLAAFVALATPIAAQTDRTLIEAASQRLAAIR